MGDNGPERLSESENHFSASTTVRGMDITCSYHLMHGKYFLVLGKYGTGTDVQKFYKTEAEARNAFDLAVNIARAQTETPLPRHTNFLLEQKMKATRAREAFFDGCAHEKIPAEVTETVLRLIDEENIDDAIEFVNTFDEAELSLDKKNKLESLIYREGYTIIDGNRVPIQPPRFTNVTPSQPVDLTTILRSGVSPSEANTFFAFMGHLGLDCTNISNVQEARRMGAEWKAFKMGRK